MASMQEIGTEQRQQMIAEAAYFRAEARSFTDGDPVADWIAAEGEIDEQLKAPRAERWLAQLESKLSSGRDRLTALKKQIASKGKATRAELKKDLEKLDDKLDSFEEKLEELGERGEKVTKKARQQAEKAWDEISELTQRLTGSRK